MTAWQTAGGQGKLHFPYAALRQLPLCELAGSEHLATQAIHFPASLKKNVRQHSGTQKGAIEAITSIHTGYMIRAPHFPAQYTAAGAAPLTTEYRRAAGLTQRGDSRLYQRAVFLCGGDHTLTAFCPLAGQPQTRQKGYIYGIFQ